MATLVLSTVGTMLGGPIGGAIGSLLGRSIDQQLLGPGPRHGPRLGDLSVQTSSYGTAIPKVFGTMRVAGSIIWSTDLKESSQTEGAKGQPDKITYSYSASFAVALSSRRIVDVRRIWADGKLIRTVDGQFTIGTGFRFCEGSEDQAPDPLIESIEGSGETPAYRGLALAIFEDMELAEFGNRIPFLTFEVVADEGEVSIADIFADVSDGTIACESAAAIAGYAAHGATVASAIEPLVDALDVALVDAGTLLASPGSDAVTVREEELGCTAGETGVARLERSQIAAANLPSSLTLGYYDRQRDYQAGLARAALDARGSSIERLELPAVLEAAGAKALAETSLGRRWARRDRLKLRLPPQYLAINPGTLITIAGEQATWRAHSIAIDSFAVVTDLRPIYASAAFVPADPGRILSSPASVPQPTDLSIFELTSDGTGASDSPVVVVAASSGGKWRPVPLQIEIAGEESSTLSSSAPSIAGAALTVLGPGQSAMFDLINSVDVELGRDDDWLESRDDDALAAGANAAIVGNEIIQFGRADPLGNRRFRLSRLLRGRRGSEWAMSIHSAGEPIVMLEPSRLVGLSLASAHVGATVRVTAGGLADQLALPAELTIAGEAMRPPSPVHLKAQRAADGSLRCTWVRRSNLGWAWLDGVDAPLGCSTEKYQATLSGGGGALEMEVAAAEAHFSAEDLASVGIGEATFSVVQVGDLATSRPASVTVTIS